MNRLLIIMLISIFVAGAYVVYWLSRCPSSPILGSKQCCESVAGHLHEPLLAFREISVPALEKMHEGENGPVEYLHRFLSSWCIAHGGAPPLRLPTCDTDADGKLELADDFGNPIVFVGSSKKFTMVNKDELRLEVQIKGILPGESFALWSVGQNGINEYGLGDDIGWVCSRFTQGRTISTGTFDGQIIWVETEVRVSKSKSKQ